MGAIAMREAAAKYGLAPATVHRWVKMGAVRRHSTGGRGLPTLIFEEDVAELAAVRVPGPGRNRLAKAREAVLAS